MSGANLLKEILKMSQGKRGGGMPISALIAISLN